MLNVTDLGLTWKLWSTLESTSNKSSLKPVVIKLEKPTSKGLRAILSSFKLAEAELAG